MVTRTSNDLKSFRTDWDSPEQIAECLRCPRPECVNCVVTKQYQARRTRDTKTYNHCTPETDVRIFELWKSGLTNGDIGEELGLSRNTVGYRLTNKLGLPTMGQGGNAKRKARAEKWLREHPRD